MTPTTSPTPSTATGAAPAPAPTIHLLPPDLVAKSAAGEVVERPASVVKELVENALDAGATAVRVEIQRGGLSLIRVSDDGCGIPPEQLELAVLRHATSKLQAFDDLYRVRTLGFRGEALASVAAVSHLELTSRPAALPAARAVRVEGGEVRWRGPAGAPAGTSVTVRHLFYNVPARQAFQRTAVGEGRHIVQLCQHLALTAPGVRFRVEVDGRLALQAPGNGSLRDAIGAVYGAAVAGDMLALPELEEDGTRVWGYCSGPAEHRNTRLYCTFAINGRLVRSQMLTYAVEEAYHALLPGGRHPLAAIHLTVPPDDLDVNVHPTKSEVRFRHERLVFAVLRRALRRALSEFAPIPALSPSAVGGPPAAAEGAPAAPGWEAEGQQAPPGPAAAGPGRLVQAPAPPPRPSRGSAATDLGRGGNSGGLRALGQIGLTYIVAEDGAGLYLIDQHSAHERVVYEQLLQQAASGEEAAGPPAQLLLTPETLDLNGAQTAWLQEHGQALTRFGFQLEPFGGRTWLLRAVPRTVAARGRARALGELIDGLIEREYGDGPLDDQARWAVACHSAVRAGDRLAPEEMAALIAQLERCDMRRTCPHGRPTMIHLSHSQLEREFGRR
ncbi:MAG TPA: DNA mismatch repair endonuclease MutL [Chloroflexota bacterium]|nr:DNA mismatch repair endonuclease MutL [Chloroflexota bacterium]